jgi:hypothetical protein
MSQCEQTQGQSVLDHGKSVESYLFDLINHLRDGKSLTYEWRIPDWVYEHKDLLLSSLPDDETLSLYTKYHDCGKLFCVEVDENGRKHFPNHAEVSYKTFTRFFENNTAAELIRCDMDIHTLKSEGVEEFCKNPHCLTLLLSGLAEIHSNSRMFGGMDSTSFKIKWKAINQRGKQITKIKSENNDNSRIH